MIRKLLVPAAAGAVFVTGCASSQSELPRSTQETQGQQQLQSQAAVTEFIEIEGLRFKLEPDVQTDGTAHLDFYVHDQDGKHVKGVKGNFLITMPDGTKKELSIEEETPHDHYHGMLKLDQPGEYLIVAQVIIGDKKVNPRFSFSRKT